MIRQYRPLLVSFFTSLYLLFVANANLYIPTTVQQNIASCCDIEDDNCCGGCEGNTSSEASECCGGTGCCGWVETRTPTALHFTSSVEQSVKNVANNAAKFSPASIFNLAISPLYLSRLDQGNFIHSKPLCQFGHQQQQSLWCIWRC